jgi:hypothetical protein
MWKIRRLHRDEIENSRLPLAQYLLSSVFVTSNVASAGFFSPGFYVSMDQYHDRSIYQSVYASQGQLQEFFFQDFNGVVQRQLGRTNIDAISLSFGPEPNDPVGVPAAGSWALAVLAAALMLVASRHLRLRGMPAFAAAAAIWLVALPASASNVLCCNLVTRSCSFSNYSGLVDVVTIARPAPCRMRTAGCCRSQRSTPPEGRP